MKSSTIEDWLTNTAKMVRRYDQDNSIIKDRNLGPIANKAAQNLINMIPDPPTYAADGPEAKLRKEIFRHLDGNFDGTPRIKNCAISIIGDHVRDRHALEFMESINANDWLELYFNGIGSGVSDDDDTVLELTCGSCAEVIGRISVEEE